MHVQKVSLSLSQSGPSPPLPLTHSLCPHSFSLTLMRPFRSAANPGTTWLCDCQHSRRVSHAATRKIWPVPRRQAWECLAASDMTSPHARGGTEIPRLGYRDHIPRRIPSLGFGESDTETRRERLGERDSERETRVRARLAGSGPLGRHSPARSKPRLLMDIIYT